MMDPLQRLMLAVKHRAAMGERWYGLRGAELLSFVADDPTIRGLQSNVPECKGISVIDSEVIVKVDYLHHLRGRTVFL